MFHQPPIADAAEIVTPGRNRPSADHHRDDDQGNRDPDHQRHAITIMKRLIAVTRFARRPD
jgi:hypothetical protein